MFSANILRPPLRATALANYSLHGSFLRWFILFLWLDNRHTIRPERIVLQPIARPLSLALAVARYLDFPISRHAQISSMMITVFSSSWFLTLICRLSTGSRMSLVVSPRSIPAAISPSIAALADTPSESARRQR